MTAGGPGLGGAADLEKAALTFHDREKSVGARPTDFSQNAKSGLAVVGPRPTREVGRARIHSRQPSVTENPGPPQERSFSSTYDRRLPETKTLARP